MVMQWIVLFFSSFLLESYPTDAHVRQSALPCITIPFNTRTLNFHICLLKNKFKSTSIEGFVSISNISDQINPSSPLKQCSLC